MGENKKEVPRCYGCTNECPLSNPGCERGEAFAQNLEAETLSKNKR